MDVPLDVKKHGKAEARSWLSQGGGDSSDNQEKIAAVRLPSTDSRKPLGNDASIVVVTDMATDSDHHSSLSSTSSFASSSSCLPRTPVIMRVKLPLHNRDQVVKKLTKHPLLRASQGPCGNEGIKAARQRFLQEKAANQRESRIAQQSLKTLDKGYHTTGMPPLSPALNVHRSESSTSPRSGDSTSCSLASHVAGCQAVIEVPQRLLTTARQMPMNGRSNVTHNTSSSYGRSSGAPKHSSGRPQNGSNYLSNAGNGNATYGNGRTDRDDWTSWVELSVKVFDLPTTISTRDLWKAFSREGSVKSIELYEDARGVRQGRASIRFRYACLGRWGYWMLLTS